MQDNRLLKQAIFGIIDERSTDDLVDWCNKDISTLHGLAMDRRKWSHFVKYVMDTNGH